MPLAPFCMASALLILLILVLEVGVMSGGVMADRLFTKILVPVDFSPCSEEAFRLALSFAKSYQAEVLLLHVVDTKSLDALNRLGLPLKPRNRKSSCIISPASMPGNCWPGMTRRE